MFTESEIDSMIENPRIKEATLALKKDFCKEEAPYLDISDHDFFGLVMLAPAVGVALANGSVSLFEELALNKKARKLSKGGYFLKKDPVVYSMKFLLKSYEKWEDKFFSLLLLAMDELFDRQSLTGPIPIDEDITEQNYNQTIMAAPYILIRFFSSFFLSEDEEIINSRTISKAEFERLLEIGKKLELDKMPVFYKFTKTFKVKG